MSSRLRPKISDTERMYCPCLWWPRRFTKIPTSWRSAATSSSRRSRTPRPCSDAQVVEEAHREGGHVPRVGPVDAVLLPERGGGGQHLAREVLDPVPLVGADHVEEEAGPQRRLGHEHASRPGSRGAAPGRRGGRGPGSRPRRGAGGRPRRAARRRAPSSARRRRGSARGGRHGWSRSGSSPTIWSAAKRASPPRARKCLASRSGISRRMSSTMFWTVRWKSRTRCSWLPCQAARFCRMRIAPRA